jgi:hypothetical protein
MLPRALLALANEAPVTLDGPRPSPRRPEAPFGARLGHAAWDSKGQQRYPADSCALALTSERRLGAAAFARACHPWHARGQGFKSPQLHQALRVSRHRSERRLPAICQQMTHSGRSNA